MQIALVFIAAALVIIGVLWLASRWASVRGARVGAETLARVAELSGGTVQRLGVLGTEVVVLERGGVVSRILLDQQVGAAVVRRTTQLQLDAPGRQPFDQVAVVTMGNSEPSPFGIAQGHPIGPLPRAFPAGLEAHSRYVVPALQVLREPDVLELVQDLRRTCGLARWELALSGTGLRFAVEGFLLEEGAILELNSLLWRFLADRRKLRQG